MRDLQLLSTWQLELQFSLSLRFARLPARTMFDCRTIDVDVGNVNLDVGALFRRRSLEFHTPPPSGNAIVVFNAADFGNFLAHRAVGRTVLVGRSFVFDRQGVTIDPVARVVAFNGTWGGREIRVALSQTSAGDRLVAHVVDTAGDEKSGFADADAQEVALAMGGYFNNLEIDLDGPKLKFSSLCFEGAGARGGKLKLSLKVVVRKLPSIRAIASF